MLNFPQSIYRLYTRLHHHPFTGAPLLRRSLQFFHALLLRFSSRLHFSSPPSCLLLNATTDPHRPPPPPPINARDERTQSYGTITISLSALLPAPESKQLMDVQCSGKRGEINLGHESRWGGDTCIDAQQNQLWDEVCREGEKVAGKTEDAAVQFIAWWRSINESEGG